MISGSPKENSYFEESIKKNADDDGDDSQRSIPKVKVNGQLTVIERWPASITHSK